MARFKKQRADREDAPRPSVGAGGWLRRLVWPALIVVAAVGAFLFARHQATSGHVPAIDGLPSALDSSALVVGFGGGGQRLLLATHVGLYESENGGSNWNIGALDGEDVLVLAHSPDGSMWAAGPDLVAHSSDGGLTWVEHGAKGLPPGGVTGLAVRGDGRLYVAAEGGLFVSADAGESFRAVQTEGGGEITGLAASGDVLLTVDGGGGIRRSDDGGETWEVVHEEPVRELAVSAAQPKLVLATGDRVWLSTDGGVTWEEVLEPSAAAGAVAWSPESPDVAYVLVPGTRELYRTDDGGGSWSRVG